MFRFSNRSKKRLYGFVHPDLVRVIDRALALSDVDFGVIEGLRSLARQKKLVATGASKTLKSYHLKHDDGFSHAADVLAYVGSRHSYDWALYVKIADAVRRAATELGVRVRWGGCWYVLNSLDSEKAIGDAVAEYVARKKRQGKTAFLDGAHFQIEV